MRVPAERHFLRDLQVHKTAPLQQTPGDTPSAPSPARGGRLDAARGRRHGEDGGRAPEGAIPPRPPIASLLPTARRGWTKSGAAYRREPPAPKRRRDSTTSKKQVTHILYTVRQRQLARPPRGQPSIKKKAKKPAKHSTLTAAGALTERPSPRHRPSPPWSSQPTLSRPQALNHKRGAWRIGTSSYCPRSMGHSGRKCRARRLCHSRCGERHGNELASSNGYLALRVRGRAGDATMK